MSFLFYIFGVFIAFFLAKNIISVENENSRQLNIICAIISLFSWLFIIFCFILLFFNFNDKKD